MRRAVPLNPLDERQTAVIALAGGIVAAIADAAPTGSEWVDRPLVGLVVAAATWASASAPWWAVSATAGIAAVAAIDPVLTVIGAVGFVGGLWIGVRRRDPGPERSIVGAIALNVLVRLELEGFFGLSAILGITFGALLFIIGARARPQPLRRAAWTVTGGALAVALLATIGFGLTAVSARSQLTDGQRLATEGIDELRDGNFEEASSKFAAAGRAFTSASDGLDRPWALPARLVPVVAQNASALSDLADAAGDSSTQLAASLAAIDPDTLRFDGGRIDLAAIDAISDPLADAQTSLDALSSTVANADSSWLLAPVQSRVDTLAEDIDENEEQLANAVTASELAPQMLGRDGPRRYLFIFTTPAEARGLGGFMGNFAEITAVDGRIAVERFGRTTELNSGGRDPLARRVRGPQEWIDQWGRFGFVEGPMGTTGAVPWSNITMSPHFPSTARVISELYPQSGGQRIDGVYSMDPYVLAALLEFTGPVQIEATDQELNADNAVEFLLRRQYQIDDEPDRVDLLVLFAEVTIDRVLEGAMPCPTELVEALGPLAAQGRFVGWSADPDEQALFEAANFSGSLPALDGADGVAVVINNAAANKLDVYLERELVYQASVDPRTGEVSGTLEVTLTNTAPASGLPGVVINNEIGRPPGTSRSLVSIYTALPVLSAAQDGEPLTIEPGHEQGWNTARALVRLPAGGSTTIVLTLAGQLQPGSGYEIVTRPQPLARPEIVDVRVSVGSGEAQTLLEGESLEPRRVRAD